jgi:hypothetical protein
VIWPPHERANAPERNAILWQSLLSADNWLHGSSVIAGETELEMVRRHVRRGLILLARQHEIIAKLRKADHPTQLAEAVFLTLQSVQIEHELHLARIS